jgi:hypothetical protein
MAAVKLCWATIASYPRFILVVADSYVCRPILVCIFTYFSDGGSIYTGRIICGRVSNITYHHSIYCVPSAEPGIIMGVQYTPIIFWEQAISLCNMHKINIFSIINWIVLSIHRDMYTHFLKPGSANECNGLIVVTKNIELLI